ncbi:type IX secretion system outer membrane channel protein PorV [Chitinophaga sp. SYP-B3965]|uniref:type IX secretion system outer membrane channel protein PorV n=1 Tax=Chitinophaga sp. SYP-B3965 TaxID=2663120 RepID=UPI00129A06CB|nr:type IX secretion system outer membrane channel protein PorV [Chitinophaga sp. SYP-B3965]MRG45083.1 type IX secretion system outer membrane channel protein PorV [Chitinophaga sp. SYP-B3965]
MKKIIITLYFIATVITLHAQDGSNQVNITTTAVPFLRISPDARSGSMGEAAMGLSPDVNSVFYNQAKTSFNTNKAGVALNYSPWMKEVADDMYFTTLAGFYKPTDNKAIAASLRYFSLGNVPIVDYNGNKLNTSQPREFAFDLGYSVKLSQHLGIGLTARYIRSKLATGAVNGTDYKAGSAVAADLSLFYTNKNDEGKGWSAGLALSNLGTKISYTDDQSDFIPANLGVGAAYTEVWDKDNRITIAADINKLLVPAVPTDQHEIKNYYETGVMESWLQSFNNQALQLGTGIEYQYKGLLSLRLGYSTRTYAAGNWQNLSVGTGLSLGIATINFAYLVPTGDKINRSPLSNTIRLGVAVNIK